MRCHARAALVYHCRYFDLSPEVGVVNRSAIELTIARRGLLRVAHVLAEGLYQRQSAHRQLCCGGSFQ